MTQSSAANPEQLRETIVRAAIPLIPSWEAVTTAGIAHAAGVDEAAVLSVFADRDAVLTTALQAYVTTALDPTQVLQDLHSISLERPLAARLAEAVGFLDIYHQRAVAFLVPLETSGSPPPARGRGTPGPRQFDAEGFRAIVRADVISQAVARLLEPDRQQLRLSPEFLADAFLGLYSGRKRRASPDPSRLPADQLVALFLHGALP
jgi:AcrR family transcriptional regulator